MIDSLSQEYYIKDSIVDTINSFPNKFIIISAYSGYFGSLLYRVVAASNNTYIWKDDFSGTQEELKPLEWPRLTEGFFIYNVSNGYIHFKENHFATAHISFELLENMKNKRELLKNYEKGKKLILRTHNINCHNFINCKIIRLFGNLTKIIPSHNKMRFRRGVSSVISPIYCNNVFNLNIENFLSDDYEKFEEEYLELCNFLDTLPNINNVRSFCLLLKEKLTRFQLTLS